MSNDAGRDGGASNVMNRRKLLQTVGAGAAGLLVATGTATAHRSQFFGCSQVCTDTEGNYAVVSHRGTYECRPITRASDRNNLPWDWGAYCYEAETDEAIVGMIEEDVLVGEEVVDDGECMLCLNPNRCAEPFVEEAEQIVAALNDHGSCTPCLGDVVLGTDCKVYGSNGQAPGNGDVPGHERGADPGRGRGRDNSEERGRRRGAGR